MPHRSSRWIAPLLLSLPAFALAQEIAIGGYDVPTANSNLIGVTAGPDGALWFTEVWTDKIGRITTAGAMTEYAVPTANSGPWQITAGPDGALWFTEMTANKIGRITTAGIITEYDVPTANSEPYGISAGPDGALWFTEANYDNGKIGRISTVGMITEYVVPAPQSFPRFITAAPDDALWFTESGANNIGRITTAGAITEYPVPQPNSELLGISAGPDGALWFTEGAIGNIGRITTAGAISVYPVPGAGGGLPACITAGPDGALWFTEEDGNSVGRITTAGVITAYPIPTAGGLRYGSLPFGIATGPDGALWITESSANRIGQAVFVTANLSVTPASGYYRSNLTFTGSGFAPSESVWIYKSGIGSAVLAGATADASGSFSAAVSASQSAYGPRIFVGVGQRSGKLGAAGFSMEPHLKLNPTSGTVGSTAMVEGYGFGSLEMVKIYWNNPRTLLGTAAADVHGTFNGSTALTFAVPLGAAAGTNGVFGRGEVTEAVGTGAFTVK